MIAGPSTRKSEGPPRAEPVLRFGRKVDRFRIEYLLGEDPKFTVETDLAEKARMIPLVARPSRLANPNEQDVAVAIDPDRLHVLHVARGLSFVPAFFARTRVKVRLPGLDRLFNRAKVHPGHHQHFAALCVLYDRGHEPIVVPADGESLGDVLNGAHGFGPLAALEAFDDLGSPFEAAELAELDSGDFSEADVGARLSMKNSIILSVLSAVCPISGPT